MHFFLQKKIKQFENGHFKNVQNVIFPLFYKLKNCTSAFYPRYMVINIQIVLFSVLHKKFQNF